VYHASAADDDLDRSLDEVYNQLWRAGRASLLRATYQPDETPRQGDRRWGLSLVVPVEGPAQDVLAQELRALHQASAGSHIVYKPGELHLTVRSLEGYADEVSKKHVARYARLIRSAAEDLGPIRLRLRGLGGSPSGLFAQGYVGTNLQALRQRLYEECQRLGPLGLPGADAQRVRNTAHISLVVFRAPVVPERELASYVDSRRKSDFGTFEVPALTLVRYRPTARRINVHHLARIELAG
jgi:2'-5' RNA ligase